MYNHEQNYTAQAIKRTGKAYKKLLAIYNALLFATDEGVYEITIRSQAGAIAVPVSLNDGGEITDLVIASFSKRLGWLESNLNRTIEEAGLEAVIEREKEEARVVAHEATCKQARSDYNKQGLALAHKAISDAKNADALISADEMKGGPQA